MSDEHSSAAADDRATGDTSDDVATPTPAGATPTAGAQARIGEAERTLAAAAEAAVAAEKRAEAEIRSLEADLERWRTEADRVRKELELRHEEELAQERAAKEQAIAAAEERLGEIETQTDAAEARIAAAERRADAAEKAVAAEGARAREGAAAWLRARIDQIRREGGREIAAVAEYDVAVVGGGAAGLWTALRAAEQGGRVCVVSRTPLNQSASFWAQGGLAAALEPGDSPARHAEDTIAAGRGLCRPAAVRALVEEAPAAVRDLQARGVVFDLDHEGRLDLGLEGGHSARRIVHSGGSQTGREITSKLAAMVAADERIEVRERTSATALWSDGGRCHGVITDVGALGSRATVLATGGAAALWRRTTNPRGAIGAGPVFGAAAGADLADLEFCQFHPTALALPDTPFDGQLITEAIRGEGAKLLGADGERFTDELAPRDEVSAAILAKMREEGSAWVRLDLRGIDPARFPNVFASLDEAGLDPRAEPVPVSPAAHYTMGGVAVDLDGRSSLPGLYAVGECSCTGLHGANRLASNSLSECFVFGGRAARAALAEGDATAPAAEPDWRFDPPTSETRDAVWRRAGPLRNPTDLAALIPDPYPLAKAIALAALERRESRGPHLRTDFPDTDPALDGVHVVLAPDGSVRREAWT